jgi:hypothetical protein
MKESTAATLTTPMMMLGPRLPTAAVGLSPYRLRRRTVRLNLTTSGIINLMMMTI